MVYRYEIGRLGPKYWIILFENDIVIWTGDRTFTVPIENLINEAYLNNIGNYSELPENLTTPVNDGKIFVIRIRVVSAKPDTVSLGDYKYGDNSVEEQLIIDLENIYGNLNYSTSFGIIDIRENGNEVELSMTISTTNLGNNLNPLVTSIKNTIENVLNNSIKSSSNQEIPINPKYSLVKNLSDDTSNTFSVESNGGGWYILYQIDGIEPPVEEVEEETEEDIEEETEEEIISEDIDRGDENTNSNTQDNSERKIGIENIFPPTIKIDEIEYNSDDTIDLKTPIGKKPFIWFNDMQINVVQMFKISSANFLPTITITFQDTYGYFDNLRFANDDDRVKVFIDTKNQLLRPIYIEFKILNFIKIADGLFKLDGIMNVNKMLTTRIESFKENTSFEVLKKVAKLSGLGFSSNINNTNDSMTWLNPGNRGIEFSKNVIKNSYRSDGSFMWGFVDFFYNLNFIDIETQLNNDITKQLGILGSDLKHIKEQLKQSDENDSSVIYLSNDRMADGSPFRFEEYKIFNSSTKKSIEQGYTTQIKYYDWQKKEFLIFKNESMTSDKDADLILKSNDDEFLNDNVMHVWEGKLINSNAHTNYHYSNIQNNINLTTLQKIGIEVTLPTPNFNLYKFMKIYVLLVNQGVKEINPIINKKLSGEWLIIDNTFVMEDDKLKQKVKLVRRNLGFSEEEVPGEVKNTKTGNNPKTSITDGKVKIDTIKDIRKVEEPSEWEKVKKDFKDGWSDLKGNLSTAVDDVNEKTDGDFGRLLDKLNPFD